jgi:hypothetical protein
MSWLLPLLFTVVLVGLVRSVLIVVGLYKTPIIHSFESYGQDEVPPMPVMTLAVWMGALTALMGMVGVWSLRLNSTFMFAGILVLIASAAAFYWRNAFAQTYHRYAWFPRWYYDLRERTTRYERRRIAYMWLMLPRRSRLIYNSSDLQFRVWADFIILGTTREEEKEIYDSRFYMGGRG